MAQAYDVLIKLVMLGDSGVGKSCLLLRFSDDTFTPDFLTTIGIDFKIKTINLNGKRVKLQIWDTAGQERFRTIITGYRGANGLIFVYDVTDENSFLSIRNWMNSMDQHAPDSVKRILIGNKADMVDQKVIETERVQKFADEFGIKFFECSAKTDQNVTEAFIEIARQSMGDVDPDTLEPLPHPQPTQCC
jgi:Ras-related protein Rab-8A